jgi:hypothetical protein
MNYYLINTVHAILKKNEIARDDWMLTVKEVHDREMYLFSFDKSEYYFCVFNEKLTNIQTISRTWRLLQEKFPELRGTQWEERQKQGGQYANQVADAEFRMQLELFDFDKLC